VNQALPPLTLTSCCQLGVTPHGGHRHDRDAWPHRQAIGSHGSRVRLTPLWAVGAVARADICIRCRGRAEPGSEPGLSSGPSPGTSTGSSNQTNNNIIRIHFGSSPCAYAFSNASWTFPVPCDLNTSSCTSGLRPSGTTAAGSAMKRDKSPPAGWCAVRHRPLKPA